MPNLFRIGEYYVYFWSNENNEPIHVHVNKGKPTSNSTKLWITKQGCCILVNNNSKISEHDLNKIMDIIDAQFFLICAKWKAHFNIDEIKYFC